MGKRGPLPKPADTIHGHRSGEFIERRSRIVNDGDPDAKAHPVSREWGKLAKQTYNDFKKSKQSRFYQQSDWAMLWLLCNELDVYSSADRRNGQMLSSILAGFSSLLATEGDRRRLQIELTNAAPEETGPSAGEAEVLKWRERISG